YNRKYLSLGTRGRRARFFLTKSCSSASAKNFSRRELRHSERRKNSQSPPPHRCIAMMDRRATSSGLFYERKRGFKVRTVPTDCVRSFLWVDLFPMSLHIHTDQRPRVDRLFLMISPSQTRR